MSPLEYKFKGVRIEPFDQITNPRKIFEFTTSKNLALITGTSNIQLTREISHILKEDFGIAAGRHPDGEIGVQLPASVDGRDVYIVQSTPPNANNIMELLLLIDACKRSGAPTITTIIPYLAFSRQDRKDAPRVSISARLIADLIQTAGASVVGMVHIHADQELGFFNIPANDLSPSGLQIETLKNLNLKNPCYATTDFGGVKFIRKFAKKAGADPDKDVVVVVKHRDADSHKTLYVEGDVQDREVVFVDDIINSATSLTDGALVVQNKGARKIFGFITHGMMIDKHDQVDTQVLVRISDSPIETLYITNTIKQPEAVKSNPKIKIISVAPLIAEAIKRLHLGIPLAPDLILE